MTNSKHTPERRKVTCVYGRPRKTWCGPYALAVIGKTDYENAYKICKKVRRKRSAAGISNSNFTAVAHRFGVSSNWKKTESMKLKTWIEMETKPNTVYVVQITRHYIIIDTRDCTTIDNQKPEWIDMSSSKHLNKKVHNVMEIRNPKFEPNHQNLDFRFQEKLVAKS